MDLGKPRLDLASTYSGDPDSALQDTFRALGVLSRELAVLAGTAYIECSVAIAVGKAVNINNGLLRLADAATNLPAVGICFSAAAIGQKAGIIIGSGFIRNLTGLTANSSVYLGNAGAFVYALPGAGMKQGLGFSLSTTEMFVTISQPS